MQDLIEILVVCPKRVEWYCALCGTDSWLEYLLAFSCGIQSSSLVVGVVLVLVLRSCSWIRDTRATLLCKTLLRLPPPRRRRVAYHQNARLISRSSACPKKDPYGCVLSGGIGDIQKHLAFLPPFLVPVSCCWEYEYLPSRVERLGIHIKMQD